MQQTAGLILIVLISYALSAETVKISGKVTKQGGKPLSGAIISLKNQNIKDTTDSEGKYILTNVISPITPKVTLARTEKISMNNGAILLNISKPAQVSIDIFDVAGSLLKRELNEFAPAGEYRFNLSKERYAPNMTAVRVSIGDHSMTFRYLQAPNGKQLISTSAINGSSNRFSTLAKLQAAIDSVRVSAPSCTSKSVAVTSYDQTLDISMDTLPRFSFFVTSLAGLRRLSGSPNGFGGDFRFGKTGQGAGLLGADSICSCLAESSMKGARYKQWRAFLSAVKGPEGKQVNAIERIGSGPWYDRMGRVVANNVNDLKKTRPASADPQIKNDLPNEDGIPNNQPDPNKPAVDNHLTITGSDSLGMLYTGPSSSFGFPGVGSGESVNATCEDWTSKSTTGSKPRAGMSWPQKFGGGMAMKNWISVWSMSGCAPGVDSTETSGAGKDNGQIGSGGGYGGFYCFSLNP